MSFYKPREEFKNVVCPVCFKAVRVTDNLLEFHDNQEGIICEGSKKKVEGKK